MCHGEEGLGLGVGGGFRRNDPVRKDVGNMRFDE